MEEKESELGTLNLEEEWPTVNGELLNDVIVHLGAFKEIFGIKDQWEAEMDMMEGITDLVNSLDFSGDADRARQVAEDLNTRVFSSSFFFLFSLSCLSCLID